jgi:galactokinase
MITAEAVARQFQERYGVLPEMMWRAPGRVNLMGDHTDYQGGFALPIAVPYATWIASRARPEGNTVRVATDYHQEYVTLSARARRLALQDSRPLSGIAGFITAVWDILHLSGGADLLLATDLPVASGLSSSAALSLGLLATAGSLARTPLSLPALISAARTVENRYLGVDSGILDPLAIALAEEGQALWVDAAAENGRPVAFAYSQAGQCLWIIDTHSPRTLAGSGYQDRVRETAAAAAALRVPTLREATAVMAATLHDPILRRRALHVVTENERVKDTVMAAGQGNWDRVKALFWDSHESLSRDYAVSTSQLDETVALLKSCGIGARLTGAGFGGSVIALGVKNQEEFLTDALQSLYRSAGWPVPNVMSVRQPAGGLNRIF